MTIKTTILRKDRERTIIKFESVIYMIRTLAILKDGSVHYNVSFQFLKQDVVKWYWVDFQNASVEETKLLSRYFHFHPLSIEDCVEHVQRPKLDYYDTYMFIVLHALHQKTLELEENDLFIHKKFIVTYHPKTIRDLNNIWHLVKKEKNLQEGPIQIMHKIANKIVDDYFPPVYQLEDLLNQIEENTKNQSIDDLMKQLFTIRSDLYKIRRTIIPIRDLLYRVISSEKFKRFKEELYFHDRYDHLFKIVEMIEANRELTADIRDSYLSFTSNRMNMIMITLTVISSVFMPLIFIVGIYGMNFRNMPELEMEYGYFIVLTIMGLIVMGMMYFFIVWVGSNLIKDQNYKSTDRKHDQSFEAYIENVKRGVWIMQYDHSILTNEEKNIVKRLKYEMFQAISIDHIHFYKKEIEKIYEQAERRANLLNTLKEKYEAM